MARAGRIPPLVVSAGLLSRCGHIVVVVVGLAGLHELVAGTLRRAVTLDG